jgi:Fic family protein
VSKAETPCHAGIFDLRLPKASLLNNLALSWNGVMGLSTRVEAIWPGQPDAYGPRRYRSPCRYSAYVPDPLGAIPVSMSGEQAADVGDVERALAAFDMRAQTQHDLEKLARFLLRAEAVASSKIEGLQVNARRLARHEAVPGRASARMDRTAEAVMGNVRAMVLAVDSVAAAPMVTLDNVLGIHRELMSHTEHSELAGHIRTEQNWIGGNDFNPCSAAFVPPPPDRVHPLMGDLCDFINRDDLPAVVQAALTHAQFETIHPFADGNGRVGRALIHVVLRRRGVTTAFVPPISLVLATQSNTYVAGLTAYRYDGAAGSESATAGVQRWVDLFVAAAARATDSAAALIDRMVELESRWRATVRPRRGSTADRILPELIAHPVVSVGDIGMLVGVSRQAATQAVKQLGAAGVITQVGGGERYRLFEASEVFTILTDYERALATESGDTKAEQPHRPVPYRR